MQSQIIQRTPSIQFKFDDQSHRNFSKSSFALDYSISNQKHILSNNRLNRLRSNQTGYKNQFMQKNHQLSPFYRMKRSSNEQTQAQQFEQDEFMILHKCNKISQSIKKQNHKTQDFFQEFDKKYEFTFQQDDIRTHQFILQAENQGGSCISRGFLNFQEFQVEQTMKFIQIQSSKDFIKIQTTRTTQEINSQNLISFTQSNEHFASDITVSNDKNQTQKKKNNNLQSKNQSSIEQFSSDKQNQVRNEETQFEEVISFGPNYNGKSKVKKYRASNSRHFVTKDFEDNSSLLQKSRPILDPKRRVPFKNIQNLIQKSSHDQQRSQTRKKSIINTDLLISTINKTQKNQVKQTNGVWSNPINNKKSSSLQCTFNYDNMFKTNAFRQTLKSTTLQNWRKKYHKKIEHLGDGKTVLKKQKNNNIFQNLFIRA